jgi:hypothetical protein
MEALKKAASELAHAEAQFQENHGQERYLVLIGSNVLSYNTATGLLENNELTKDFYFDVFSIIPIGLANPNWPLQDSRHIRVRLSRKDYPYMDVKISDLYKFTLNRNKVEIEIK